jgi:tripartite-type tricarboxylate transporter receptor subunit TctC
MIARRRIAVWLAALAPAGAAASVRAQQPWPARPLRIIVVYPPGGLSDGIARALGESLTQRLGVKVFVENRAGAGGGLGMEALARAEPDGHTLAFSAVSPLTLKPHLEKVSYDPFRDIAPVAALMYTPVLLVGTPAFEGASFADVVALARARPGALRWATSGVATAGHLVLEQVGAAARIVLTHIPYKGGGQQITDALGGQFELLSTNMAAAQLRLIRDGRLKPLAVGAPARLAALPAVPTFAELGFPQANLASLFGIFAPGGTPAAVLDRLNEACNLALAEPAMHQRLLAADNIPAGGSRADFARQIEQQWAGNRGLKGISVPAR